MKTILGATKRYFLQELVETQNGAKKKKRVNTGLLFVRWPET